MGKYKKTILFAICFVFSNTSFSAENEMSYVFKNSSFNLTKACVEDIRAETSELSKVYVLNIAVKKNQECAEKLNTAIADNVGTEMSTFYNGILLNKSNIVGKFRTENGFRMTMNDQDLMNEILMSYK